jgi:hypothetical protein
MGVYDSKTGYWVGLPIEALVEALVQAEYLTPVGKLDTRDAITLTIPSGTGVAVYATVKELVVPSDEVWFLTQIQLDVPAPNVGTPLGNFRISEWPDATNAAGKPFWAVNQGVGTVYAECFQAAPLFLPPGDFIGTPIKLPPGSKLTLFGEVTVAALGADRTLTLTPYGWKAKRLVE